MYQRPLRSDELYHWGLPWRNKKPKYIFKVQDGNYTRYFYSQDEVDAYRNADNKVNAQKKTVAANPLQGIKDFVDYKITGRGYTRDAKRKNKAIDDLAKLRKDHPLRVDEEKASVFKEMAEKTKKTDSKIMDPFADSMSKKYENDYRDYVKGASKRNRTIDNTTNYAKQFNLDEAEKKAMNNSLFGKVNKFFKKRSDNKVVNFMRENPDYAENWLKSLGIKSKEFNPKKAKNADSLKKTLVNRGVMKETETLNDVLEEKGFMKERRGRLEYYKESSKDRQKKKKNGSLKHSASGPMVGNKHPDKFSYIAKVGEGSNTRYFYSQEEIDAYRKSLSSKELANTNIKMINERTERPIQSTAPSQEQAKPESNSLLDTTKKMVDYLDKNPTKETKKISTPVKDKSSDKDTSDEDKDEKKSKKSKSGGGSGRGSGKGKGKSGKGKGKGKEKEKLDESFYLEIGKMSDEELIEYLNKHKDLADKALSFLGLTDKDYMKSGKVDLKNLTSSLSSEGYLEKGETLYDMLDSLDLVKKKKSVKHSDDELQSFLDTNPEELMHYGRQGMKWYQHIFGPVQAGAKYAKKAGAKLSEAKSAHDAKAETKWEKKKEEIIRSGNPDQVRKYQNRMTDDDLRRAKKRIDDKNELDTMTGHESKSSKQAQNFVNQNGNKQSRDLIRDFNNISKTIGDTYKSFDTIMSTIDSAKKYTPEGRAKQAEVDDIMKNLRAEKVIEDPKKLSYKQLQDFNNAYKNYNSIKENYNSWQENSSLASYMSDQGDRRLGSFKEYQTYKQYAPYGGGKGKNKGNNISKSTVQDWFDEWADEKLKNN